jgi:hypothetical protein
VYNPSKLLIFNAMTGGEVGRILEKEASRLKRNSRKPWHYIDIPKSQRKGKTPEELDQMRMEIYLTEREKTENS